MEVEAEIPSFACEAVASAPFLPDKGKVPLDDFRDGEEVISSRESKQKDELG